MTKEGPNAKMTNDERFVEVLFFVSRPLAT
jgi:hypothetical protein